MKKLYVTKVERAQGGADYEIRTDAEGPVIAHGRIEFPQPQGDAIRVVYEVRGINGAPPPSAAIAALLEKKPKVWVHNGAEWVQYPGNAE